MIPFLLPLSGRARRRSLPWSAHTNATGSRNSHTNQNGPRSSREELLNTKTTTKHTQAPLCKPTRRFSIRIVSHDDHDDHHILRIFLPTIGSPARWMQSLSFSIHRRRPWRCERGFTIGHDLDEGIYRLEERDTICVCDTHLSDLAWSYGVRMGGKCKTITRANYEETSR